MKVIVDTNIFLASAPRKSPYYWFFETFLLRRFHIAFSNEMLLEYQEKFFEHWHPTTATDITQILIESSNTLLTNIYFRFNLIYEDPDNNKFCDCYLAAGADYLVTSDKHFNTLKQLSYPRVEVINLHQFKQILLDANLLQP